MDIATAAELRQTFFLCHGLIRKIFVRPVRKKSKRTGFKAAKKEENDEVKKGNYNFKGVGKPNDL